MFILDLVPTEETLRFLESALPHILLDLAFLRYFLYVSALDIAVQIFPLARRVVCGILGVDVVVYFEFCGEVVESLWCQWVVKAD